MYHAVPCDVQSRHAGTLKYKNSIPHIPNGYGGSVHAVYIKNVHKVHNVHTIRNGLTPK